jgi:alginate O-acetyltransferase complex protein AlgI
VIWGGYHGLLIVFNHGIQKFRFKLPNFLSILITFFFVCYGWVFFKAADLGQALAMTRGLFGLRGIRFSNLPFVRRYDLLVIVFLCLIAWFWPNLEFWAKKIRPSALWLLLFVLVFWTDILFLNRASAFLYFQF